MTALRFGSATHTGMVRTINQDSSLVAEPLFAVADGMGGHAAGEVASQVAVEALRLNAEATAEGLVHAVRVANRAVWDRAASDASMRGMGTTLCAVVLAPPTEGSDEGDTIVVANVGDSRVYLFHDGELEQITEDHSLVEDLVREGRLTHEEAKSHPQRNVVTRVLGIDEDVEVDSWQIVPYAGDRLLLCSDGLFNEVEESHIAGVLRRLDDPDDAAAELVRLANEGGGRDNITVVLVDVVGDGGRAEAASAAIGERRATTLASEPLPAGPGEEREDGTEQLDLGDAGEQAHAAADHPPVGEAVATTRRPRRVTWRVVLFSLAVLGVLGAAAGAVTWFARSTYYVGLDGDDVAIYQGRPGGVLWFQPTLEETSDLTFDDVPAARQPDVEAGKEESTLGGARRYVARLREQAGAGRPTTTTSGSTTTASTTTTSNVPATSTSAPETTTTLP